MGDKYRDGIVVSWLHPGTVSGAFTSALTDTLLYDGTHKGAIVKYGGTLNANVGPRIASARCDLMRGWLASSRIGKAKWMLMIDSDMTWDAPDVYKLLEAADPIEAPIVGGLCFAGGRGTDFYPTVFDLTRNEEGALRTKPVMDYPRDAMVKVGGTGAAFLLIHKRVAHQMYEAFGTMPNGKPNPYPWFVEGVDADGNIYGEDTGFCRNASALDIPVHVHTGVKIGHVKDYELTEELWDFKRSLGYVTPHEKGKEMIKLESRDLS